MRKLRFPSEQMMYAVKQIDAEVPSGVPEHVVRTVTENSRTLKFSSLGFEGE